MRRLTRGNTNELSALLVLKKATRGDDRDLARAANKVLRDPVLFENYMNLRMERLHKKGSKVQKKNLNILTAWLERVNVFCRKAVA